MDNNSNNNKKNMTINFSCPDGMVIDMDNTDLSKGTISFKQIENNHDGYLKKQDDRAHSWDELTNKLYYKPSYLTTEDGTEKVTHGTSAYAFVNEDESKGVAAFCKLIQLRRDWIKDWEPDWDDGKHKGIIENALGEIRSNWYYSYPRVLSFPTEEMTNDFLNTYRNLLEQAKNFI